MLQLILTHHQPDEWEDAIYEDRTYHTFDLRMNDVEYANIVRSFSDRNLLVRSLQRVQNPFQLGRFIVRKEQKEFRHERADILKYYHPIHNSDLKTALEYNMDVRRYGFRYPGNNCDDKKPKFYQTPNAAFEAIPNCNDKVILVCDILGSINYEPIVTSKDNDSEYKPTYVVALRN